jgi:DNA-binding NarL/FixJ family response regulator
MKTKKGSFPAPIKGEFKGRNIQTFVAEDTPVMMSLFKRILSKDERITIVGSAFDGRKALLDASMLDPDLVLTDLHLPGLDGAEVARRLKERPSPPIIFVATSDDSPESRARCLAAGVDAFLVKSGDLAAQLEAEVHRFFDGIIEGEN